MASTYRVRRGDSLSVIAKRQYKDASLWPEIARANHLTAPYTIFVGQELVIPNDCRLPTFPPMSRDIRPLTSSSGRRSAVTPLPLKPLSPAKKTPLPLPEPPTARPVLMPAFKYELENVIRPVEVSIGQISYTFQLKGEVTIQGEKALQNFSFVNMKQIAFESKSQADVVVGEVGSRIANSTEFKYDPSANSLEVSTSLKTELTLNGDTWLTQSITPVPPNGIRYSYQPRAIKGKIQRLVIEGNISLDITVRINPQLPSPQIVPVQSPVPVWQKIAAVGLFVVAGGIIVATLAEDVVTLLAGVADDPASFGAAAAAYSAATLMWTGPLQDKGIIVSRDTPTEL